MRVEESTYEGTPLVVVHGDVDHYSFPDFAAVTSAILDRGEYCLAIDLRGCPFMDSAGITVLFGLLSQLPPQGCLIVITVDPNLSRVFGIVGLSAEKRFHLVSSPEESAAVAKRANTHR
jgi:anti-anti-sigma factor